MKNHHLHINKIGVHVGTARNNNDFFNIVVFYEHRFCGRFSTFVSLTYLVAYSGNLIIFFSQVRPIGAWTRSTLSSACSKQELKTFSFEKTIHSTRLVVTKEITILTAIEPGCRVTAIFPLFVHRQANKGFLFMSTEETKKNSLCKAFAPINV